MYNIALLCATGVGSRMNSQVPKQYLKLNYKGKQQTILEITLDKFINHEQIDYVFIAISQLDTYFVNNTDFNIPVQALEDFALSKQQAFDKEQAPPNYLWLGKFNSNLNKVYLINGLGERFHTVYSLLSNALDFCVSKGLNQEQINVFIHDVVRCGITKNDISNLVQHSKELTNIDKVLASNSQDKILAGILPGVAVVDSVKSLTKEHSNVYCQSNLDRNSMILCQTPQIFNLHYQLYLMHYLMQVVDFAGCKQLASNNNYCASYYSLLTHDYKLQALEKTKLADSKILYNIVAKSEQLKGYEQQIINSLTDDTAIPIMFGDLVKICYLEKHNMKITVAQDLALAQFYLDQEAKV